MTWYRPDSSYDDARPYLAATGKVMGSAFTRDELDAAHENGRTVVTRKGSSSVGVIEVELTRDEVIALARRWLESRGYEDTSWGGWLAEQSETLAQNRVVQAIGEAAGSGSVEGDKNAAELATWLKVGVGVVVLLGVAWGLSSVAAIARAVKG